MARIQKATETASRTKPRSTPIKVDPNKINRMKTSANRATYSVDKGPRNRAPRILPEPPQGPV